MAGRYTRRISGQAVADYFQTRDVLSSDPLHNIRSERFVPVIRLDRQNRRRLHQLLWGLIPHWEKAPNEIYVNGRSETADQKLAFREAFGRRHCLIPADGFFVGPGRHGAPYVHFHDDRLFTIAELWERWLAEDGKGLDSWVMLTTAANSAIRPYHYRMPAIIRTQDYDTWLRPRDYDPTTLKELLVPHPPDETVVSAR